MTRSSDPTRPPRLQRVAPADPQRAWRREQDLAHRVFHDKVRRITAAAEEGRRTQGIVRDFLRHPLVRLSAVLRYMGQNPDRDGAYALLDRVDAWSDAWPPTPWYSKPKPNGSSRPICLLPPELKALHGMLAAALAAQLFPSPGLFGIRGKGRDAAARRLKELQNSGYACLAKVDIVDCFQSINPDALDNLPLPKEVIRRTLDPRNLRFTQLGRPRDASRSFSLYEDPCHNPSGPRGLLQGSPVSSIILAWLLDSLPTSEDAHVLICFDNIVIAARDMAGCRTMIATLADALHRCPAGPLELCPATFSDSAGLEFLSYLFPADGCKIGIAHRALSMLEERLLAAEAFHDNHLDLPPIESWRALRSFANGFAAVDDIGAELNMYIEMTGIAAESTGDALILALNSDVLAPKGTLSGDIMHWILFNNPVSAERHTRPVS